MRKFDLPEGIVIAADGACPGNGTDVARMYGSMKVFKDGVEQQFTFDDQRYLHYRHDPIEIDGMPNTAPVAEVEMMVAAMSYCKQLIERTGKPVPITIVMDNLNNVGYINNGFKVSKKAQHLAGHVTLAREMMAKMPSVKMQWISGELMKQLLGH